MLIRLVPRPPLPTVLFTLTFLNPPPDLPLPINFVQQLHQLGADDLEPPGQAGLYALDNAAWLVALLRDVTFDMTTLTVTCTFVDGAVEEWPLMSTGIVRALEQVLADVEQSAVEMERERRRAKADDVAAAPPPAPTPSLPLPSPVTARPKHKRQRSLLMSIASSFAAVANGLSSRSTPTPTPTPTPPPAPPAPAPKPEVSASRLCSRALRRRARSTLVDTYNLFVIPELRTRVRYRGGEAYGGRTASVYGGYAMWIAHSMLRRADAHMDFLVREAGGVPEIIKALNCMSINSPRTPRPSTSGLFPSSLESSVDTLIANEGGAEDDADEQSIADNSSTSTDDSASIQTPTDGGSLSRASFPLSVPRTPSPESCLSPQDLETYNQLFSYTQRVRRLIKTMDDSRHDRMAQEERVMQMLEVKSRRRAWSTKRLLVGSEPREQPLRGALVQDCGLAIPVRRSPLGWCLPISASDADVHKLAMSRSASPGRHARTRSLKISSAPHDLSELFPVCEEDDIIEEEFPTDVDLEAGMPPGLQSPRPRHAALPSPASTMPPRPTLSPATPQFFTPLKPAPRSPPRSPPRTNGALPRSRASSDLPLLCQPLVIPHGEPEVASPEYDEEFTLGMELPGVGRGRGRGAPRYDHDEWLPGIAAPPGLVYP